ncbi:amidohydrolase [Chromobacterium sphagni]|uniref:Amidohydrolase n=1 Tax=Chromobacterium sphagni TaxID=1903179 RepID=A0A1S1WT52_9NEIS|nr:amidohydrolase family protein [Chromobacterium sphagni]OHX10358.1 amidohydrolase [Chromobacterium sphagni]
MEGKIALEEHFAMADTIQDSQQYFTADSWPARRRLLLDIQDRRLEEMDRCGIELAILSLNSPAIQAIDDAARAVDAARRANDFLAEQVARRPKRFAAFAALPLQDADAASRELRRAVTELGCVGALANGFSQTSAGERASYYDQSEHRPFWAELESLDVPFYLHPRNPLPSQQLAYRDQPWLLGPAWAFAMETGLHALRLMGSGLFDRHPRLNIILGHLGEMLPGHIWRSSHWASASGRNPQGVRAEKPFIDYFRKHFHVSTSGNFHTIAMRQAMDEIGAERVLFATDYPFEDMVEACDWFDRAEIGDNDRERIGRGNALRLFRLEDRV